jgi:hypothetical protein
MKSPRTHQFGFGLRTAGIFLALFGASLAHAATINYAIDVSGAALAGNGPFWLDFQWNYGSGSGVDKVTIGNLQLTGGSLVAGSGSFLQGGATSSGDLSSTLTLNNSSAASSRFNEFVEQMTAGVTEIKFNLSFSGANTAETPSGFSFTLDNDDASLSQFYTTAPDGFSLLTVDFNGQTAIANTYTSVAPSISGVHIPDATSTAELLFSAMMALGLGQRLRRKSAFARA